MAGHFDMRCHTGPAVEPPQKAGRPRSDVTPKGAETSEAAAGIPDKAIVWTLGAETQKVAYLLSARADVAASRR